MTKKHAALLENVLEEISHDPHTGQDKDSVRGTDDRSANRYTMRSSALAARLSGNVIEKTLHWVEPERCRIWDKHNRRYELLDEHRCADLIEGFKAQGQQEFPAIVRQIRRDPEFDYEVICGARRHWTVSWLRRNNYRNFRFLVEVRDLTDEEAFRLSDVENRDRDDICDFERATDYALALQAYYAGKQKDMAKRLEVSETWLSRYLRLAKLPEEIIAAYSDVTHIRERHARELIPLLAQPALKEKVFAEALAIANEQHDAQIDGVIVFNRLKAAGRMPRKMNRKSSKEYFNSAGRIIMKAASRRGGRLQFDVIDTSDTDAVMKACRKALDDLSR